MSLILDALKKLEQEKVARRGKGVDIGPAILRGRTRRPASRWKLLVTLTAGVLVLAGVAIVLLSGKSERPAPKAPTPEIVATPTASMPPAPQEVAPLPIVGVLPPEPASRQKGAETVARPEPSAAPPLAVGKAPAAISPTDLKVSGIAWQDERGARRAVVNGLLVGEGATVAGVRITEILPDRIRVSLGGKSVEIPFSTPFTER